MEESEMVRILGRANSINVQKVMWLIGELELNHERVDMGLQYGGNDTEEYLKNNPNGLIPTVLDGKTIVWESHSIIRYLAEKFGSNTPWWPDEIVTRAHAGQWMDWYTSRLNGPMTTIFWNVVRHPPEKRDPHALAAAVAEAEHLWGILDKELSKRDFMGGAVPSISDIPVGCAIHRWSAMDFDKPSFKHLAAWYARLATRPAYQVHVMLPLS